MIKDTKTVDFDLVWDRTDLLRGDQRRPPIAARIFAPPELMTIQSVGLHWVTGTLQLLTGIGFALVVIGALLGITFSWAETGSDLLVVIGFVVLQLSVVPWLLLMLAFGLYWPLRPRVPAEETWLPSSDVLGIEHESEQT